MKKSRLFLTLLVFISCKNTLDKSIHEPLTKTEVQDIVEKDSSFNETYKYVEFIRDTLLIYESEKNKYKNLKYRNVLSFYKFMNDTTNYNSFSSRINEEWKFKYGGKEIIDDTFTSFDYEWNGWLKVLREKDSLSYSFFNTVNRKNRYPNFK